MKVDDPGFPAVGLAFCAEAPLDPVSGKDHGSRRVGYRLIEVEKDQTPVPSIQPQMIRQRRGWVKRFASALVVGRVTDPAHGAHMYSEQGETCVTCAFTPLKQDA